MSPPRPTLLAAIALLAASANAAPARETYPLTNEARQLYARMLRGDITRRTAEELKQQIRGTIFSADLDGGGVSASDIERARAMADTSERAQRIAHYFRADFDRDGILTREEYRDMLRATDVAASYRLHEEAREQGRPSRLEPVENVAAPSSPNLQMYDAMDRDRDGRVSLAEAWANDVVPRRPYTVRRHVEAEDYLRLDANRDGIVTLAEVDATSAAFLAEQETAGAGPLPALPPEQLEAAQARPDDERVRCDAPPLPPGALILRLGTREAKALSSVTLAGQDKGTFLVRVRVEAGDAPLYVIATSYDPTIWAFEGAVRRVTLVASSFTADAKAQWPAAGATGLARRQVHVLPYACFGQFDERNQRAPNPQQGQAAELARKRLGRSFDLSWGAYRPGGIALPSMQPFAAPQQRPAVLADPLSPEAKQQWERFLAHHPGGIATLRPAEVMTPATREVQQVLPYQAGVAQLLQLGALRQIDYRGSTAFLFTRPARYPSNLFGGHSETFVVLRGMAEPEGDSGHSKVFVEGERAVCLRGC